MDSLNVALMKVSEALVTLMMIRDVLLKKKNPIKISSYLPVTGKIFLFDAINRARIESTQEKENRQHVSPLLEHLHQIFL